ncbi:MAG: PQQ-like beta-propeller repeat protein [Candidatus Sumerlaeota bacterium]|nr:PQQ-like beta-propeller repeat protein [Candidatus Sumerlaeota bacterium]
MSTVQRTIGVVVVGAILGWACAAYAQDSPQWRGVNRDGKVSGFKAPAEWPKALTQKWKVAVGAGDATPALVGDKLYAFGRVGEDEVLQCLEAATGKEVWKDKYAAQTVSGPSAAIHSGPRSSPAVAEGKAVAIGVGGILTCWDAASGKRLWQKDPFPKVVPQFYTGMSPMILDGMAIAHLGGKGNGALIAYALATGDEKWKWEGEAPEYCSPVLLTADGVKQLVTLAEKSVVGIGAADGKLLWQIPFMPSMRNYNSSTPIVDGSTVIFTGGSRGTKAVKIEKKGDAFAATEVWSNGQLGSVFSSLVLKDGMLYGISGQGMLFCMDAKTGKEAWSDKNPFEKGFGSVLDAGSVMLAMGTKGELVVFKANGKAYEEVARIKAADSSCYAQPVVAGDRIYVKDKDSVIAWALQ